MKHFILILLLIMVACKTTSEYERPKPVPPVAGNSLVNQIDSWIATEGQNAHIGVLISSVQSGQVIYAHDADRLYTPASTLKLVTAAAALQNLGPGFRYTTKLATQGFNRKKHIVQDLFLIGQGDPTLTDMDLATLAHELLQLGVKNIEGDIVIDASVFDDVYYGNGWMWDDASHGFSAPISGVNVNQNRFVVRVNPGNRVGEKVQAIFEPYSNFIRLDVKAKTSQNLNDLRVTTAEQQGLIKHDAIDISGELPVDAAPVYKTFAVSNPNLFAGHILQEKLKAAGIRFNGNIRVEKTPQQTVRLTEHVSRQMSEMLIDFMKASNNHGMECLLKTMGAKTGPLPGTFDGGLEAVQSFLRNNAGVSLKHASVADGSGASRYSLMSPTQMVKLLLYAWNDFHIAPEFIASLPLAGLDGTLATRFSQEDMRGKIRAKTGSLSGVSSLAGYLTTPGGDILAFAIMVNGFTGAKSPYLALQEKILALLVEDAKKPNRSL